MAAKTLPVEYACRKCLRPVARLDRRRRPGDRIIPGEGLTLERPQGQAPRIRCRCGCLSIFIEGGF